MRLNIRLKTLVLAFGILFSSNAFCTLGEKAVSAQTAGQKKLSQSNAQYSVQESVVNGTTIHEYILPSGTVFGVTWRGITHPDLTAVLGSYHSEYQKLRGEQPKTVGRAPINLKSSKVSVRMSGHMRDVHGQAYDPNLLPSGFSLQDFK